jgi:septal ring factor EnvC (AmiA/AmiB activator)
LTLRRAALLLALLPAVAQADQKSAAEAALAAHRRAAALARQQAQAEASRAAALAQQQVQAAAALRRLEDETAADTEQLASLTAQQQAAARRLHRAQAELGQLLPVMQRLAAQPAAAMLAVPQPPAQAVRAIAVVQGIAAQIETEAEAVKAETAHLAALMIQTRSAQTHLTQAVTTQQNAEAQLSAQIMAAKSAAMADAETEAQEDRASRAAQGILARLAARAAAAKRASMPVAPNPTARPEGAGAPVAGQVIQAYGAATAAGPAQGISYGAAPGARVIAPCAGTVLFAGPFPAYGHVVIAGCGASTSIVLAGMATLDVTTGERVVHGQPVGEMPGYDPAAPTRQPVLYFELRRNGVPVDPSAWLARGHF